MANLLGGANLDALAKMDPRKVAAGLLTREQGPGGYGKDPVVRHVLGYFAEHHGEFYSAVIGAMSDTRLNAPGQRLRAGIDRAA